MADPQADDVRPEPPEAAAQPALVIGLGASAGGISALRTFFSHAPPDVPYAYVVILHLSPDHDSKLADVLQAATPLRVTQVRDRVSIAPKHVYVIPPNQSLQVVDGSLTLSPMTRHEERRAPVDVFFRTLANHYGGRAVAVVLSGTGPNGSNGLKRVKERGGLTIAQNPGEAQYADMPTNAIATGLVDYVLSAAEMAERIVAYHERLASGEELALAGELAVDDGEPLREVMSLLRARTSHDFSSYKPSTIRRRIGRRMGLHDLTSVSDYARLMREQPEEAVLLMKELLISVTEFFRDPKVFSLLEQRIIPRLFEGKTSTDQVRVWSAGCATGEEAYALGMLLVEHASTLLDPPIVQVFATDLDEQAIAVAREGLYTEGDVADVTADRLQRFFQRESSRYRVRRELRELVMFAHHNVIRDPPFSHLDLVACRNLLIYLNRAVQERLIETFHFALRPGRYLVLGTSESAEGSSDLFMPVEKSAHVYESRSVGGRLPPPAVERFMPGLAGSLPRLQDARPPERVSAGDLHLRLLEQLAPPSLVVTEENTVVHISEHGGRFLQLAGGEPSRDVLKLIHPDLRVDLRTALHLALQQRTPVEVRGARLGGAAGELAIKIAVKPVLREGAPARGYFVVMFEEEEPRPPSQGVALTSPTAADSPHLEEELARVKTQLRVTIEQYETQAEERKAANEELQAMNEELRSSTEELETSKEELQSVNEELSTVNQELKIKIEELRVTNNDLQNLINSTEIGAVFLDKTQRVKLATPRAREVFNLLPGDAGRKLSDITSHLSYPDLHQDVAAVLAQLRSVEREVSTRDGRWYYLHIVPYRTLDDRIEGVAITFQDVTRRRSAEGLVRTGEERLRLLIDSAIDYAIFTLDVRGRIDYWNSGAERLFGYRADEIVGREGAILFTPEDRAAGVPAEELERAARAGRAEDDRWHLRRNGERFFVSSVTMRLGDGDDLGFAKIARDLTDQRQADYALRNARAELEDRITERTAELRAEVAQHEAARQDVTTLLHRIVTAQEDERARIARDLHDQLGQQLTALRMALERHAAQCAGEGAQEVERALALTRQIDTEIGFLAWELRPAVLDDLGLAAALPRFLDEWSAHYGITSQFATTGTVAGALSREAEVTIYRIAQESLNNVVKHAHASRVDVLLERRDHAVVMVIEDDGVGFDPADTRTVANGIGLAGIRERASLIGGSVEVESQPGNGTTVFLRCPVAGDGEAPA
jgi:two-component system CheB/CheR fusion protein